VRLGAEADGARTFVTGLHALAAAVTRAGEGEPAKGILSAERGISVDQAFERLRRHARNRNAALPSVAEAVVSPGLRP
jgi:AmiR/NasT family two-component response regulator